MKRKGGWMGVLLLLPVLLCSSSLAGTVPDAPVLTVSVYDLDVDLYWSEPSGAEGYRFFFAPQDLSQVFDLDLGDQADVSVTLWSGAAFYVAVKAYNSSGSSAFSNVEFVQTGSTGYQLGAAQSLPPGVVIQSVSGDAGQCFDYSSLDITALTAMTQCMAACGDDPTCQVNCLSGTAFMPDAFAFLYMTLSNTGGAGAAITLDQGTSFVPADAGTQTMMIAQALSVTVPAGQTESVCLPVFCIDPSLAAPSDTDLFTLSGVAQAPCLEQILSKIDGKTVPNASTLQSIIWNCVDTGESVSQADWDWLDSL